MERNGAARPPLESSEASFAWPVSVCRSARKPVHRKRAWLLTLITLYLHALMCHGCPSCWIVSSYVSSTNNVVPNLFVKRSIGTEATHKDTTLDNTADVRDAPLHALCACNHRAHLLYKSTSVLANKR